MYREVTPMKLTHTTLEPRGLMTYGMMVGIDMGTTTTCIIIATNGKEVEHFEGWDSVMQVLRETITHAKNAIAHKDVATARKWRLRAQYLHDICMAITSYDTKSALQSAPGPSIPLPFLNSPAPMQTLWAGFINNLAHAIVGHDDGKVSLILNDANQLYACYQSLGHSSGKMLRHRVADHVSTIAVPTWTSYGMQVTTLPIFDAAFAAERGYSIMIRLAFDPIGTVWVQCSDAAITYAKPNTTPTMVYSIDMEAAAVEAAKNIV